MALQPADMASLLAAAKPAPVANTCGDRPFTLIPAADWGPTDHLSHVNLKHIDKFSGDTGNTEEVYEWLEKCALTAKDSGLTFEAGKKLLIRASKGSARYYIYDLRRQGNDLCQIVLALEKRYGGLCSPEEAKIKLLSCQPEHGAPPREFTDKLYHYARMVTRNVEDNAEWNAQIETLVRDNLFRGIPPPIRSTIIEKIRINDLLGGAPLTVGDIINEWVKIDRLS